MNYSFFKNRFKFICLLPFLLGAVVLLNNSCSTKKAGFFNVRYHNLTTHYNVWWNGDQSLQDAVKQLKLKNKDDYTNVLRIFQLGSKEDAISMNPQLDRAIEKGTKGIKKHSISIKGKEHINWVKDCYLLIGKAQFYKQDYAAAAATFRLIISQYKDSPQAFEAMIWYANCMVQDKQYSLAESTLAQLKTLIDNKKAPAKLKKKIYPIYADAAIAQQKYSNAIQYLNISIEENNNRKLNTRQYFILGQIFQLQKKRTTAAKYYEKVIRRGSPYEMEFNAKINLASCYNLKTGNGKNIIKLLTKMLKDKKNEEYQDQIYYALGEVSMASKDAIKACDYWKQSVSVSVSNKSQKLKSSLILADTYYDLFEDYESAQQYYDTALALMNSEYPNYEKIKGKQTILTTLVENLHTINNLDSILKVSEMSPSEQNKMIEKSIAHLKQKEQERLEQEMIAATSQTMKESSNALKGNWYFYNESTVQKGKESFSRVWGKRPLTDNWRLSNKEMSSFEEKDMEEEETETDENDTTSASTANLKDIDKSKENDPYSKEYYLKNLLTTQKQKDSANNEIAKAMLNAGFIYNDGLKNDAKALEILLKLSDRYPSYPYVLPAYYQLYRIYDQKGDTPNANYYKNLILRGFPDSDYANLIRDENYFEEMSKRENIAQKEYETIYLEFQAKKYRDVALKARSAVEAYRKPELTPKFLYLEALSLGKIQGKRVLISKLEYIVKNYPQHEIIPLIRKQLELLKSEKFEYTSEGDEEESGESLADVSESVESNGSAVVNDSVGRGSKTGTQPVSTTTESDELPPESLVYRYRENIDHYFILLADGNNVNVTELHTKISDFDLQYFSIENLKSGELTFTSTQHMVTVQRFANAAKAMDYYNFLTQRSEILKGIDKKYYKCFVISVQNYPTFYNQKNVDAYEKFFRKYYIK